jgi:hypothetical protein
MLVTVSQFALESPAIAPQAAASAPAGFSLDGLPRAFQLACACCMWPRSDAQGALVRAAADGVDWERFLRVVARQRVGALARDALRLAGVAGPADVQQRLTAGAQADGARSLALAAEAVRLRRRFDAEGLPALFIKGAAVAELAYGSQVLKHSRDVDVLVAPADAERAFEMLKRQGYVATAPAADPSAAQMPIILRLSKDLELRDPHRGLNLELHWRLIDNPALLAQIRASSPSQEVPVLDGSLRTLADAPLFAYLCAHGASCSWFRLKWLADLNAWLSTKPAEEIVAFYRHAERLGVGACAGQALRLCERLLGFTPPPALAAALRRRKVGLLTALALDAMVGPDAEVELVRRPFGPFRTLPAQFLRGRGAAFFLAQCGMLTNNLDDRLRFPLPQGLGFLYPLLRLPLWVLRVNRRRRADGARRAQALGGADGER